MKFICIHSSRASQGRWAPPWSAWPPPHPPPQAWGGSFRHLQKLLVMMIWIPSSATWTLENIARVRCLFTACLQEWTIIGWARADKSWSRGESSPWVHFHRATTTPGNPCPVEASSSTGSGRKRRGRQLRRLPRPTWGISVSRIEDQGSGLWIKGKGWRIKY